jgi:ATP-dependent Clp protease ATP-binding subunit ClpB
MTTLVQERLRSQFRPEFLNRIDETLIFHRLEREHMHSIVRLQLARLNDLLADRRMHIEATDEAVELLANRGYDPDFGARPLKRTIQRLVQDPLANLVLTGEVGDDSTLRLEVDGGELALRLAAHTDDRAPVAEPEEVPLHEVAS